MKDKYKYWIAFGPLSINIIGLMTDLKVHDVEVKCNF